ncbi:protein tyrosine kinase [Nocardia puris]|uniref:Receptor protein-tyrosine kinase n=1 Tax=Nocardia puris TaxID=208602 RepID=A0A366DWD1_9NOCA|nr:Wzz/FepE/Etk N-terminal domain-containing protein [Nocardia puris]MBF6209865.1 protein tyrosine kinase [Nocardia puris]MBF6366437.1 protein tyrosine kinase [Nocardia puris]MBF6458224.1 protein tyrosine kinase [Nocardia puris]RBO94397.1 receptor protein-tyrosine kinase [Nocardia puris]
MNPNDIRGIVRRRWLIIGLCGLFGVAAAVYYAQSRPVTYTASSTMYVSMATGTSVNDSYQGGLAAQQRVRSYLELASSAEVAERVLAERALPISAEQLRARITASSPPATSLLTIAVTDSTAEGARELTDVVVAKFRTLVDELETIEATAAPAARVAVVDTAQVPTAPTGPGTSRLAALGLLAGLALGAVAALVRDRTDRRPRDNAEVEAAVGVPVFASVAPVPGAQDTGVRVARTRLHLLGDGTGTFVVTALSDRSAPEVAGALTRSFAAVGSRALLIDADTTGPATGEPGLAELFRNGGSAPDLIRHADDTGAGVLPVGGSAADTADALARGDLDKLLPDLRGRFDVIVIAAPPAAHPEALTLATAGTTVGVVEPARTTVTDLRARAELLTDSGGMLAGALVVEKARAGVRLLLGRGAR